MNNNKNGLIHVYFGDGKGKTTAATGLAVRAEGCGCRVVFAQFMKCRKTGETDSLQKLGIEVIRAGNSEKFSWEMTEKEKDECRDAQAVLLGMIKDITLREGEVDLIILDEALNAAALGFLDEEALKDFVYNKPACVELVLTGCIAPAWLLEKADYITEMKKCKHPFDEGIAARESIEY